MFRARAAPEMEPFVMMASRTAALPGPMALVSALMTWSLSFTGPIRVSILRPLAFFVILLRRPVE